MLVFYLHDFSDVCASELCAIRDNYDQLAQLGALVYGISSDSVHAHEAWKAQQGFRHPLLADMTGVVARQYGAWDESRRRANRLTVVIDRDGIIHYLRHSEPWIARPFGELVAAVRQAADGAPV